MPYQGLTVKDLILAFEKVGMRVSDSWLFRLEQKCNLKLPRSTTNFKKSQGSRKLAGVRMLTETQIEEIVEAFKPGGKGYWSYENI